MAVRPQDEKEDELATLLDKHLRRVRLWVSTGLLVGTTIIAVASYAANKLTGGIHAEIGQVSERLRQRETADSVRFERVADIIGTAVVAIVEPAGSPEQVAAIAELKKHRHVVVP